MCFLCECHMFMHAGELVLLVYMSQVHACGRGCDKDWCACLYACHIFMHVGVKDGIGVLVVCICDLHLRMCVHVFVYLCLGPGGE